MPGVPTFGGGYGPKCVTLLFILHSLFVGGGAAIASDAGSYAACKAGQLNCIIDSRQIICAYTSLKIVG